ncbi:hypothetical protein BU24DRAFT_481039 [Aaosphaeria arxii CBS 175.79]|uniref:Uncharacterized protein n=1 Tax=Aaosphaeria arxii CBS 175.79 TaxID=1450172 RepID=A0A6A5XSY4_9PLEO|nr:uncharacterized protein BU24DRAFT_481039 [Aaosphaeria arxii CBS 175.79]KAF2016418.1 hypothetical protein BU24DRAFT_481039 [Aaosphaeria arxii CBS 175.79]
MSSQPQPQPPPTLTSLLTHLLPHTTLLHAPSPSSPSAHLTSTISSLQLHPTLEAALHLANADLPSAHFLVRHMQAAPAVEGMLLHAILHRCEGDFANARAWLGDVGDVCAGWVAKKKGVERLGEDMMGRVKLEGEERGLLGFVYGEGSEDGGERLVDDVEGFRERCKGRKGREGEKEEDEIEGRIRRELEMVVEWCRGKFGDGRWVDASSAWVRHGDEVRQVAEDMVSGNKGFRKF